MACFILHFSCLSVPSIFSIICTFTPPSDCSPHPNMSAHLNTPKHIISYVISLFVPSPSTFFHPISPPPFIPSHPILSHLVSSCLTVSHIVSFHRMSARRGFVGRRRALSAGLRRAHVLTLSAGVTQLQAVVRGAFSRKATRRKRRIMAQNRLRGGSVALIQAAYRGHRFDALQCVVWSVCRA